MNSNEYIAKWFKSPMPTGEEKEQLLDFLTVLKEIENKHVN